VIPIFTPSFIKIRLYEKGRPDEASDVLKGSIIGALDEA
jgi:hypothetical protein